MKMLFAAAALSLVAGAAIAGEGQGNPFPFNVPGTMMSTQGYRQGPGVAQNPFPFTAPGTRMVNSPVLPTSGSDGVVQTANSLPPGFEDGVPGVANLNRNAPTPTRLAQPTVAPNTHG